MSLYFSLICNNKSNWDKKIRDKCTHYNLQKVWSFLTKKVSENKACSGYNKQDCDLTLLCGFRQK